MVGISAEKMVRGYHVDLAVCSAKGIDEKMGVTDSNEKDSEMKRAIFSSADKKLLALDSTKFDKKSFVKVCDIGDLDIIVTDKAPSEAWQSRLSEYGVKLIY